MREEEYGRGVAPLLERLKRADQGAWAEVIGKHRNKMFSFTVRMLRNRQEAEDVCQEVWERAIRSIATFRGEASLDTWLCSIARNRCLTRLEAAKRVGNTEDDAWILKLADDAPGPYERAASNELRSAMERAFGRLELEFREAILLLLINGLTYEEIAHVTNTPVATVKTRVHRARIKLQGMLAEFRP